MATMHEPINYLDRILNEEETKKPCQYNHNWRNYSISRSGRFKSKNRKRDGIDGRLFDEKQQQQQQQQQPQTVVKEQEKNVYRSSAINSKSFTASSQIATTATLTSSTTSTRTREVESYKSFYETNL